MMTSWKMTTTKMKMMTTYVTMTRMTLEGAKLAISPTELLGQVHQRLGRVTVASLIPKEIGSVHNAFYGDMDIGLPILRIVDVATLEMHMEQATFIDSLTGHTSPRPPDAESLFYYRVEALD